MFHRSNGDPHPFSPARRAELFPCHWQASRPVAKGRGGGCMGGAEYSAPSRNSGQIFATLSHLPFCHLSPGPAKHSGWSAFDRIPLLASSNMSCDLCIRIHQLFKDAQISPSSGSFRTGPDHFLFASARPGGCFTNSDGRSDQWRTILLWTNNMGQWSVTRSDSPSLLVKHPTGARIASQQVWLRAWGLHVYIFGTGN